MNLNNALCTSLFVGSCYCSIILKYNLLHTKYRFGQGIFWRAMSILIKHLLHYMEMKKYLVSLLWDMSIYFQMQLTYQDGLQFHYWCAMLSTFWNQSILLLSSHEEKYQHIPNIEVYIINCICQLLLELNIFFEWHILLCQYAISLK